MIYGDVTKNEKEIIRVQDGEYKGVKYVDVRVHFKDGNGELQPTKKGVALSHKYIPALKQVLVNVIEENEGVHYNSQG